MPVSSTATTILGLPVSTSQAAGCDAGRGLGVEHARARAEVANRADGASADRRHEAQRAQALVAAGERVAEGCGERLDAREVVDARPDCGWWLLWGLVVGGLALGRRGERDEGGSDEQNGVR
jgi:hypothetical protein